MPSASELFYTRRSRHGRPSPATAPEIDEGLGLGGLDSPTDRNLRRRHSNHHAHRHDLDGCDPLRRSPHLRHHHHPPTSRSSFHSDPASLWVGQGASLPAPGNSMNVRPQSNLRVPNFSSTERLPGSVLLARERLLERLRGVSLSGNRRSSRGSSAMTLQENIYDDRWRLADLSDWGVETLVQSSTAAEIMDLSLPSERVMLASMKKPPGLSKDAVDHLHREFFHRADKEPQGFVDGVKQECCICLESFMEGDQITRLPCEHRFHSACLDPWVRTCGDCPYCRKVILVHTG